MVPRRSRTPLAGLDFGPDAVSFVSATHGWALADVGCVGCARIFGTTDAGKHWTVLSRPALPGSKLALLEGEVDMYFADARHGYIFTASHCGHRCVLSTTDGGRSWTRVAVPPVSQLTGGGDAIYALTNATRRRETVLSRTMTGTRRWVRLQLPPAAAQRVGPEPHSLAISAQGPSVALLVTSETGTVPARGQLGRLWTSADNGDTWHARPNPCTARDGGAALVSIALDHPDALLLDCYDGKQSSQDIATQHHLYGSADDATHWIRLADPSDTGAPSLLADNGAGHAFLAVENGGVNMLRATLDGASHWHRVIWNKWGFYGWSDLRFVNATTGFVLGPTHYAPTRLYRTRDAGRHWNRIPLPHTTG